MVPANIRRRAPKKRYILLAVAAAIVLLAFMPNDPAVTSSPDSHIEALQLLAAAKEAIRAHTVASADVPKEKDQTAMEEWYWKAATEQGVLPDASVSESSTATPIPSTAAPITALTAAPTAVPTVANTSSPTAMPTTVTVPDKPSPPLAAPALPAPPEKDELIIYMATNVFGVEQSPQGIRNDQIEVEANKSNGYVNCGGKKLKAKLTHDEAESEKADFWIFHCRDQVEVNQMQPDGEYGKRRRPHQLWVWFCEEHDNIEEEYEGLYNLTMSPRLESDIPMSYFNTDRDMPDSLGPKWTQNGVTPMAPFAKRTAANPIAWAASNCGPVNNRTGYIEALMGHIGVDSFGPCLNTAKGMPTNRDQMVAFPKEEVEFMSKYKFYLSFENANCKGYVSEKLPKTFLWNLVPIIGGPPDGLRHTPTGMSDGHPSAIHAKDFPNAAALAEFIKKVAADEKLYNAYHEWRANPKLISQDYRKNFPPQSLRPHDVCKFVDVWHYQRTGNRIAKPFEACQDPGPGTGWV